MVFGKSRSTFASWAWKARTRGRAPIRKRTSILTSSDEIATEMAAHQCAGDHRHVNLTARGTKTTAQDCQIYPDKFCHTICKAYTAQVDKDAMARRNTLRRQPIGRTRVPAIFEALVAAEVNLLEDARVSISPCATVDLATRECTDTISCNNSNNNSNTCNEDKSMNGSESVGTSAKERTGGNNHGGSIRRQMIWATA